MSDITEAFNEKINIKDPIEADINIKNNIKNNSTQKNSASNNNNATYQPAETTNNVEKASNTNINTNNSGNTHINSESDINSNDNGQSSDSIKKVLLEKINELENILEDEDKSDDLIISYLLIDENNKVSEVFDIEEVWILVNKISESWNTKHLLGLDCPISKDDLIGFWRDVVKNKVLEIENSEGRSSSNSDDMAYGEFLNEKLDICEIKPILRIIFNNIIFGYKIIIDNF